MKINKSIPVIFFLMLSATTNAALLNRGNGMIYDNVLDVTWLADAGLARSTFNNDLDWWEAQQWSADLEYFGFTDWRLPNMDVNDDGVFADCRFLTTTENECRDNEYDYLFSQYGINKNNPGDFINIGSLHYWSGTENPVFPDLAYLLNFETGFRGTTSKITINRNALAVHDGDIAAVPLPAALWLFGFGLTGLVGFARRKKA